MLQPFKMEVQQAKLEDVYEGIRRYPWFTLQQRVTAMPSPYYLQTLSAPLAGMLARQTS
jgi:hypothetical protein